MCACMRQVRGVGARCTMGGKLSVGCSDDPPVTNDLTADADDDTAAEFTLTDHERQLIDSTWKHLTAPADSDEELGVRVFIRIFELDPAVMDAFPHFGALPDLRAMRHNVMFRMHGRRFVRAVRSVVDNLDSLGVTAVPNLDLLGRKHRDFHGFRTDYLQSFEAAMEDVWREALGARRFDKATRRAWRKVFKLITSTVMHGYEEKKSCPATASAAATDTPGQTTAATPNDINGSLVACNNAQPDCGLSS